MITAKFLIGFLLFFLINSQAVVSAAEEDGFCAEEGSRFRTYPQCGGTLGLEDKPIDQTFWVIECTSPSGIRTYQNRSLGNLRQCPTPTCPATIREYPQCGGTIKNVTYPKTHSVRVFEITDCNGNISYQGEDKGDKGECGSDASTYSGSSNSVTTRIIPKDSTEIIPNFGTNPVSPIAASSIAQAKDFLKEKWGLNMVGNWSLNRLQLIITKFSGYSQTRPGFIENIKGERIELIYSGYSNQLSGYVKIREYSGDDKLFIAALAHELGHVIYNNRPNTKSLKLEHDSLHTSSRKAISTYNVEGNTAFRDRSENYAELIAYCVTDRPIYSVLTEGIPVYRELGAKIVGGCN